MNSLLNAIDYINNGGSQFCPVNTFDADFEPIGEKLRRELVKQKAITIENGVIKLADKYTRKSLL